MHSRITRPARLGTRVRERRVRLRDAVPVRHDRRELRRQFRRACRAEERELRAEAMAALQRLSAHRVLLSGFVSQTRDMGGIVEFSDGTRLLVWLFNGHAELELLGLGAAWCPVWLEQVRPCFGHRRCWLLVASADQVLSLEVLASVQSLAPVRPEERGERR